MQKRDISLQNFILCKKFGKIIYLNSHGYPENFTWQKFTKLRCSFSHAVKLKTHHLTEVASYKFKKSFQYMNTPAYLCTVKIKAMYGLV